MRVVSIGDLVTDYYYKNEKLLGVNGGMTAHNIIANLSKFKFNTSVYAVCGDDCAGKIAIRSLSDLGVDTSNIDIIRNIKTRCFHVSYFEDNNKLVFSSKKRCPFCHNKKWYEDSLINTNKILSDVKKDDILIFDNLNIKNQEIVDNLNNKKIIDIGQYFEFDLLKDDEVINKIKGKFDIINFNERVTKYLIKRFNLKSDLDIYKLFLPKLITITRGESGATFIYDNQVYNFSLNNKSSVLDSTGAGDAFIASVIKDWIKNDFKFEVDKFSKWYDNSTKLTYKVVQKMGARGHLKTLYKINKVNDFCTCDNFVIVERKKIKRCNININNLEKRLKNAISLSVIDKLDNIGFNENENYLFIGTGGSFAGANFASTVINRMYGCNTYSLYPRDVIYRNNKKIDKAILFSYSGTTNDVINSVSNFDNSVKYLITKGNVQDIVLKTGIIKSNIVSYRNGKNKGKERGFLSFEGAVAPACIFLRYYYSKVNPEYNLELFIDDSINYWKNYFENLFNSQDILKLFSKENTINIFKGDNTNSACLDIESKIVESGLVNCIVHEKKNFSHGRFINYENLNNRISLYFKQKTTNKYENRLLEYLKDGKNIIVESRYDGLLCEFDLLIASQFLIYFIGKGLDIDVSKPKYSDDAMKIYFYKGEL